MSAISWAFALYRYPLSRYISPTLTSTLEIISISSAASEAVTSVTFA